MNDLTHPDHDIDRGERSMVTQGTTTTEPGNAHHGSPRGFTGSEHSPPSSDEHAGLAGHNASSSRSSRTGIAAASTPDRCCIASATTSIPRSNGCRPPDTSSRGSSNAPRRPIRPPASTSTGARSSRIALLRGTGTDGSSGGTVAHGPGGGRCSARRCDALMVRSSGLASGMADLRWSAHIVADLGQ